MQRRSLSHKQATPTTDDHDEVIYDEPDEVKISAAVVVQSKMKLLTDHDPDNEPMDGAELVTELGATSHPPTVSNMAYGVIIKSSSDVPTSPNTAYGVILTTNISTTSP